MKVFLIILMLIVTVYAIECIVNNGKEVEVGKTKVRRYISSVGCIAIALIAIAFNIMCVYLMVFGA